MLSSCVYLQLSQGVVTLLLARSLLCAQHDQLVNAVSHCSESRKQMVEKKKSHPTPQWFMVITSVKVFVSMLLCFW